MGTLRRSSSTLITGFIDSQNKKILNQKIISSFPDFHIEQCGFILPASDSQSGAIARLEMMGGEFCGNATRSAIALLTNGASTSGLIEVSGTNQLLEWSSDSDNITVQMPLPKSNLVKVVADGVLVALDGITHLVIQSEVDPPTGDELTALADNLMQKYSLKDELAAGISWYNTATNQASFRVYVKAVDTLFDETACGSGTCSIGIAIAHSHGVDTAQMDIIQPSGESIMFSYKSGKAYITGSVSKLYDGEMKL